MDPWLYSKGHLTLKLFPSFNGLHFFLAIILRFWHSNLHWFHGVSFSFFRRQQTDDATNCKFKCRSSCNCLWKWVWPTLRPASDCPAVRLSGCPFVWQFSRQFATRPAQSHQRATNNVKLALYNFSRGKAGDGKCEGRQLRRLPWRPKLSAVCEQLETYESCLPNNNKINCARREKLGAKRGLRVFRLRCR